MKTKSNIAKKLAALRKMTPAELRDRYAELYGEPSRSGNKQWLIRRCAWRIQALAEGGLSERAKRRARQLARDQDLRVIPPKDLTMAPPDRPADVQQPPRRYIRRTHDARLPMPGEPACQTRGIGQNMRKWSSCSWSRGQRGLTDCPVHTMRLRARAAVFLRKAEDER